MTDLTSTATTTATTTTASTKPPHLRSPRELATADRMLRKLRGHLAGGDRLGPSRKAILRVAGGPPAIHPFDAAFDTAMDRLLDELEREAEQPQPFDASANAHEQATLRLVRD